ncbi:MAG TPA: biopolymer transporter ExbD [Opitutaceae bacterium]|jgi:biopolymer transport protein ExbD|nr:biopolymer transporter ExbD [Opitutaceae bacterium]
MITHPLDLASRLRPPPRSFDALFFVNGALIMVFFVLFGSRFVLAPGLGVGFQLPEMAGAGAAPTAVVISLRRSDQVLVDDGMLDYAQLRVWLEKRARREKGLALLVRADRRVPLEDLGIIAEMAAKAGFTGGVQWAMEPGPANPPDAH